MPASKAFCNIVEAEALSDYRYNQESARLEASWRLSNGAIKKLLAIAQTEFGYTNPKDALEVIYAVRPSKTYEDKDNVNLGHLSPGDIIRLTDPDDTYITLIKVGKREFIALDSSQNVISRGDFLYPIRLWARLSSEPLYFAVEREGFRYPSSSRFFKFGPLVSIGICKNSGKDNLSQKNSYGKKITGFQKGFALGLSMEGLGFDPENIVLEETTAPFIIELTECGEGVFGFNPAYRFDFSDKDTVMDRHEWVLDQILTACDVVGEETPSGVGRIVPVCQGVVKVGQRKDGNLWLEIIHKAQITSK